VAYLKAWYYEPVGSGGPTGKRSAWASEAVNSIARDRRIGNLNQKYFTNLSFPAGPKTLEL
jgi:hypothetical protein